MAISVLRATDPGGVRYMRFATGTKWPTIIRQTDPVISIRASVAERMRAALCDTTMLQPLYRRGIEPVTSVEDFSGHSYGAGTEVVVGLGWKYTMKSPEGTFDAITEALGIKPTVVESGFLKDHILPILPNGFLGSSQAFFTPEYLGDPGVAYGDATRAVHRSEEEITAWLKTISPQSDIASYFGRAPYLSQSIFGRINSLLGPIDKTD